MKGNFRGNVFLIILGLIIIACLVFLLGYLVGRGHELREEPMARIRRPAGREEEKQKVVFKPRVAPEIPPLKAESSYTVQVAAFQIEEKASELVNRLKAQDYPAHIVEVELEGKKWFRVRVGSFQNKEDALEIVDRLREEEGLENLWVLKREE